MRIKIYLNATTIAIGTRERTRSGKSNIYGDDKTKINNDNPYYITVLSEIDIDNVNDEHKIVIVDCNVFTRRADRTPFGVTAFTKSDRKRKTRSG